MKRDAGSLPRTARTLLMTSSKTLPACWPPIISPSSPDTPRVRCASVSSKKHWATVDAQAILSIKCGFSCEAVVIGSRSINKTDSQHPSLPMSHSSVSKSPTCAPGKCAKPSSAKRSPKKSSLCDASGAYQCVPSLWSTAG